MRRHALLCAAVIVPVAACSPIESSDAVVRRDSAGVQIVENRRPVWDEGGAWTVSAEPQISIGVAVGDSTSELVNVWDARVLRDDRLLVTDRGAGKVRLFDLEGRFLSSFGRKGSGPGEFDRGTLRTCELSDGNLFLEDSDRAHLYTPEGSVLRTVRLTPPAAGRMAPRIDGCIDDDTFLAVALLPSGRATEPGVLTRRRYVVYLYDRYGKPKRELMSYDGRADWSWESAGSIQSLPVPLSPEPVVLAAPRNDDHAIDQSGIYFGRGEEPEIRFLKEDGVVKREIRWALSERPRSVEVYDRYVESVLQSMPQSFATSRRKFFADEALPIPEFVPAYIGGIVDDEGNVWLERFRIAGESDWVRDVFSPDGRWLGPVRMPPDLRVMQIGSGRIVGVHIDAFGVQRIRVHTLEKP